MPYVKRNEQNKISGIYSREQEFATEFLPDDDVEVVAYLNPVEYKTQFSSLEYLDRFTQIEQEAIVGATYSNVQIKLYYDRLLAATFIDLDDPRTEAGIDALIAAELLAPERKAALLEPENV